MSVPLLIISDAPTAGTGLSRITRDLATRIAQHMPETFRVATAGYGGVCSRHLPFHQYILEGTKDFVCPTLPEIWKDWAGDEKGIVLTIWDLSRLAWMTQPKMQCEIAYLRDFLVDKPFKLWGYLPIDAAGPNGKLTFPLMQTLLGFDRVLAYGDWAAGVVDRTLGLPEGSTDRLPHGLDTHVFYPRNKALCRKMFVSYTQSCELRGGGLAERIQSDELLIAIVATNQARKDFALGIETASILARNYKVRLWIKTDVLERHWSIPALLVDFGLIDNAIISTGELSDDHMAMAYSASDLVLGIAPEGFGYVHVEATACGTPCIVGSYAGGAELVPKEMHVEPDTYRYEGVWASLRPVYDPRKWAIIAERWIGATISLSPQYDWNTLWPRWRQWLGDGIV